MMSKMSCGGPYMIDEVAEVPKAFYLEIAKRMETELLYAGIMSSGRVMHGQVLQYLSEAKSRKTLGESLGAFDLSTFCLTRDAVHALLIDIAARFGNIPITVEMCVVYQTNGDRFTHTFLGSQEIRDEKVYEHWKDEVLLKLFLYLEDEEDDE